MSIKGFFQNTYYRWGFIEVDLRWVFNTCANPANLGTFKMEKEQQAAELRMDWRIGPYHRNLGLTTLFYRS